MRCCAATPGQAEPRPSPDGYPRRTTPRTGGIAELLERDCAKTEALGLYFLLNWCPHRDNDALSWARHAGLCLNGGQALGKPRIEPMPRGAFDNQIAKCASDHRGGEHREPEARSCLH